MYRISRMGGGTRIFNVKQHILHEDGLLTIKTTGYEDDETHWTGWMTLAPSDPEYGFWFWMTHVKQPLEIIPDWSLTSWKNEYANSKKEMAGIHH